MRLPSLLLSFALVFSLPVLAEDFKFSDVKPDLTGYAVTAGVGNVLERFDVKVLEVMRDGSLPLVLVRGSGKFLDTVGGIGQGFSGSPVYLGDKLLGAISGGFPNDGHRLALVTPIEFMRKALPVASSLTLSLLPSELQPRAAVCLPDYGCSVPLATPLSVSGLSGRAVTALQTALAAKGLRTQIQPLQAGVGGSSQRPYKLEPGAPVAAQLAGGDVNIGAVGAVTTVEGNRVLAFGHPVFGDVRLRYLMQPAYILGFVNATDVPFKLAESSGSPFGLFLNDRPYGVGGLTGTATPLPLEINLKRGTTSSLTRVNLAPVEEIAGALSLAVTLSALDDALEVNTPGSVKLTWRLDFNGRPALEYGDLVADPDDVAVVTAQRAGLLLALLAENPYQTANLKRLSLTLEVASYNALRVVKADAEKKTLKAGESTTINLRLQPYRNASVQRRVLFRVPPDAQPGVLHLRVRGAGTPTPRTAQTQQQNPDPWDGLLTYDELLERLRSRIMQNSVLVETTETDREPRLIGLETFESVVTGWAYVDVTVVK